MNGDRWREVSRVYGAVLTKPPGARDAALDALCGEDLELRRDVESLLREEAASGLLDGAAGQVADALLRDNLTGRTLGPYRLEALQGEGGMGQVYRATDTRLQRTVAIKVLPPSLAEDPQFRARFDREAKAIGALNHSHICALYDVGREPSTGPGPTVSYLVMEYVEGETLAARLGRGAIPFEQALTWAIEIAEALAAAHKAGVVHRDVKPGNVMVTKSGTKLLDFGLAKSGVMGAVTAISMLPTTPPGAMVSGDAPLTARGMILGTLQYMAPEQLEGGEVDSRTDIFAFAALLYELLTGKKAFEGKTQASLIAAIMSGTPPPMSALQPLTPVPLERLVCTCLAKDPEDRWQSMGDVARELRELPRTPASHETPQAISRAAKWLSAVAMLAGAIVGGVAVGTLLRATPPMPALSQGPVRFSISPPPVGDQPGGFGNSPGNSAGIVAPPLAVSPDGRWIAFSASSGEENTLWLRPIDGGEMRPLPNTAGGRYLFWAPDSRSLAFFNQAI